MCAAAQTVAGYRYSVAKRTRSSAVALELGSKIRRSLAKVDSDTRELAQYDFMQFMVDCAIRFERRLEQGVSVHRLQVTKYRGSDFAAGEFPLRIGSSGMGGSPPWSSISRESEPSWRCTQKMMKRVVCPRPNGAATCSGCVARTR
jgi:KaiC/GvpD/RAD55 family RecA-like ATPase